MLDLTPARARALRMRSLLLNGSRASDSPASSSPSEIVTWLGAMQSQDIASGLWSLGARLPGWTQTQVHAALERAEVLRTWPMRGTIHLVPSADAAWMLELTGQRSLSASLKSRQALGLDMADAERAAKVLEEAMTGGRRLTRSQAVGVIRESGVDTSGQRGYHLLGYAALVGVICIGPQDGRDQTFVLLREWAPNQRSLSRSDALVELAFRYFRSHGPATLKDFAGWTGLTLRDARAGLDGNEGRLTPATLGSQTYWLATVLAAVDSEGDASRSVVALPGFDEFILGYKDRSLQVLPGSMDRIVPGGNGVFRATLVSGGVVVATWRRTMTASRVRIEVEAFAPLSTRQLGSATRALNAYADYLGREPEIRFT